MKTEIRLSQVRIDYLKGMIFQLNAFAREHGIGTSELERLALARYGRDIRFITVGEYDDLWQYISDLKNIPSPMNEARS
jgi:hypothetical protein